MIYSRVGELWLQSSMPPALERAARTFIAARPKKKWMLLIVGLDTDGTNKILEAVSFDKSTDYRDITNKLPLVINHGMHTATGKMACQFGIWSLEYAEARYRGLYAPPHSVWLPHANYTKVPYRTAKMALIRFVKKNASLPAFERKIFRLKLHGHTARLDDVKSYRVSNFITDEDYFRQNICF